MGDKRAVGIVNPVVAPAVKKSLGHQGGDDELLDLLVRQPSVRLVIDGSGDGQIIPPPRPIS